MTIRSLLKIPAFFAFITLFLIACGQSNQDRLYQKYSSYNFEDTLLNLDIAISESNYRIIHRSHIGQAVRDRGDKEFPLSTITSFCNITYAKEMMEINPDLINDMPCNVAVRESKNGVLVSTKLMNDDTPNQQQNEFARRINNNLRTIIEATID